MLYNHCLQSRSVASDGRVRVSSGSGRSLPYGGERRLIMVWWGVSAQGAALQRHSSAQWTTRSAGTLCWGWRWWVHTCQVTTRAAHAVSAERPGPSARSWSAVWTRPMESGSAMIASWKTRAQRAASVDARDARHWHRRRDGEGGVTTRGRSHLLGPGLGSGGARGARGAAVGRQSAQGACSAGQHAGNAGSSSGGLKGTRQES